MRTRIIAALFVLAIVATWLLTASRGCSPGERWDKWREQRQEQRQERRQSIDNQENRHPWRERFRRRFES